MLQIHHITQVTCMLQGRYNMLMQKNRIYIDVNGQKLIQSVSASTAIYVYDYDRNILTVGSLADMEFGDKKSANKVYLRNQNGVAKEFIIFC